MKFISLFGILLLCSMQCFCHAKRGNGAWVKVSGHITQTSDYCGGARPSDELLENLKKPSPLENKIIFIKIGTANNSSIKYFQKVITDSNGDFVVTLKAGMTYCFIEEWKQKKLLIPEDTKYLTWDAKCLEARYHTADFVLKVKRIKNPIITINYHNPCFYSPYCGTYTGPLPP